jgi:hypothetical protein
MSPAEKRARFGIDYGNWNEGNAPFIKENYVNADENTKVEELDFTPVADSRLIDAVSEILPNVNDDFTGKGPDLGAIEVGKPRPHYGPRPIAAGSGTRK